MRELTRKQKQVLDSWYKENKEKIMYGKYFFDWAKCECFGIELFEELEKINDTEILSQNINSYIAEKER